MTIVRTHRAPAWDPAATSVALEFHAVVTEKSAVREGPDLLGWGLSPETTPDRAGGKALRACPCDPLYTGSRPRLLIDKVARYTFFRPEMVIEIVTRFGNIPSSGVLWARFFLGEGPWHRSRGGDTLGLGERCAVDIRNGRTGLTAVPHHQRNSG